jgi:hypothetical protein
MKYLILIYGNPQSREIFHNLTDEQRATGFAAYAALRDDLVKNGEFIVSEALADPSLAKHIWVREGETMVTDGPFAEVKEQLAGFFLIESDSMDTAIERAARIPEASLGLVEVRPIMVYRELEM